MRLYTDKNGFTLLETIISFGVFVILSVILLHFFYFQSRSAARILAENELLAQSRIAMEFMTNHLRQADSYSIVKNNGVFSELHTNGVEQRGFYFERATGMLLFGGSTTWGAQELAKYIKEIRVDVIGQKMYIEICTEDNIGTDVTVQPIVLQSVVDLRYIEDAGR